MDKGTFVNYNGNIAVVVRTGKECTRESGGDLDDHLGLWFGELTADKVPVVWTIPAEYVEAREELTPSFRH